MTIREALEALAQCGVADAAVIVLRNRDGELSAAPVLAVALDEDSQDVSLMIGDFGEEEAALDDASSVAEVRDALREAGDERAGWPLFAVDSDDAGGGGSIVGFSTDEEVEIFAFLEGPKAAWEND